MLNLENPGSKLSRISILRTLQPGLSLAVRSEAALIGISLHPLARPTDRVMRLDLGVPVRDDPPV